LKTRTWTHKLWKSPFYYHIYSLTLFELFFRLFCKEESMFPNNHCTWFITPTCNWKQHDTYMLGAGRRSWAAPASPPPGRRRVPTHSVAVGWPCRPLRRQGPHRSFAVCPLGGRRVPTRSAAVGWPVGCSVARGRTGACRAPVRGPAPPPEAAPDAPSACTGSRETYEIEKREEEGS
jgi:hypothetical protein